MKVLTFWAAMIEWKQKFLPTGLGESPPVGYFFLGAS